MGRTGIAGIKEATMPKKKEEKKPDKKKREEIIKKIEKGELSEQEAAAKFDIYL